MITYYHEVVKLNVMTILGQVIFHCNRIDPEEMAEMQILNFEYEQQLRSVFLN